GGIDHGAMFAEIQIDVEIKFLRRDGGAETFETRARRLAALEAPENLPAFRRAVADVHLLFDDFRGRVSERVNDASPVRVTAVPTRLDQGAVGHGASGSVGVGEGFGSGDADRDETRDAFAVAHDHLRKFEADVVEAGLKSLES